MSEESTLQNVKHYTNLRYSVSPTLLNTSFWKASLYMPLRHFSQDLLINQDSEALQPKQPKNSDIRGQEDSYWPGINSKKEKKKKEKETSPQSEF